MKMLILRIISHINFWTKYIILTFLNFWNKNNKIGLLNNF
jgi:hypothetical protein